MGSQGPTNRISPANRAAVRRARAAGLQILLASGRSPRALVGFLAELELDGPAIAYTGVLTFRREPWTGALHTLAVEVTAAGVDKAHAVRAACAQLGIPLAQLAAIGDQENDIGMLRVAGIGIAMGNAAAAVRAVAQRTTETNERDGVARAIDELLAADGCSSSSFKR